LIMVHCDDSTNLHLLMAVAEPICGISLEPGIPVTVEKPRIAILYSSKIAVAMNGMGAESLRMPIE